MKTLPDFWFEPRPWMDGQWHSGGETVTVRNPATAEKIADVSRADGATVALAIEGAVRAQREWYEVSAMERGMVMKRTAALLLARKDEFARLLTAEQGKPYAQAAGEVEYAASFFQWFGEEARRVYGRIAAHPEAGLPDGVLQIVPGRGSVVGAVLAEHPAVRVLSLTGSTATGSALMVAAAPGIKRLSLELGGNAPFIVLPDADLDFVAEQLTRLKLLVSGQVCVTANRVFVHAEADPGFWILDFRLNPKSKI